MNHSTVDDARDRAHVIAHRVYKDDPLAATTLGELIFLRMGCRHCSPQKRCWSGWIPCERDMP